MSGRLLIGEEREWLGGVVSPFAECVLAPNPSAWTLDGTNTWLVGAPGGSCVVIDPGPLANGHEQSIVDALDRRRAKAIAILLTHGHEDHSEGAVELGDRLGVPVRALDPRFMASGSNAHDYLVDGERIEVEGADLLVIGTPGHSSDSLCFLVNDHLLTGDTVLGRGTTMVAHPDGKLHEYLTSLRKLSDLCADSSVQRLLPGHGPVVADPSRVVQYYLDHRRERLDQVRAVAESGAVSAAEIVKIVYADVPPDVWPAAEATVMAQLAYLEASDFDFGGPP